MAAYARALAAATIVEFRERVDRAASLLDDVGNVYQVANLLAGSAYSALSLGSDIDAKRCVERAIPFTRELDDPFQWMLLRGNFGLAALVTGDRDAAAHAFRDELTLCRKLVALPFVGEGLAGFGALAAARGDDYRAARLLGAAAAHRYGQPEDPVDARLRTMFFEPARTRRGAAAWDGAARNGGALSFEDAIAYALEEPRA
jgi:hypothetical protein